MDMSTLLRLSKWLNVDPSQAINLLSQDPDWKTSFEVLIRHEPALAELFKRIVADYEKGLLTVSDITDIIQYANYKLTTKEQSKAK
jgi:energy-converting hydrogenase A subunit M